MGEWADRLGELQTWRAALAPTDPRRELLGWAIGHIRQLRGEVNEADEELAFEWGLSSSWQPPYPT